MTQALQVMLMTVLISVVVGFLISTMIWVLTKILEVTGKDKVSEDGELETAVAVAAAIAARASEKNKGG